MNIGDILKFYDISKGYKNDLGKKVVFVDCMDTVIYRKISLLQLINRWARVISEKFSISQEFLYYYRRQIVNGCMHNVVSIDFIYNELAQQCIFYGLLDKKLKNAFVTTCHQVELDIELENQYLINEAKIFLQRQKKDGISIYCISDFRLPSVDVSTFFKKQGVDSFFDGVFSSCDYGMTKKDGSLYKEVLGILSLDPDECMMIGDNLNSDCINAAKAGIKAFWLEK